MKIRSGRAIFATLGLLFAAGVILSFLLGQVRVPLDEVLKFITGRGAPPGAPSLYNEILKIRMSRIAVAFIAGGGLSFAGVVYQSALNNFLADPFMLGVSAGAALFSAAAISLGFGSSLMITAFAFSGAMLSVLAVILVSGFRKFSSYNLILSGIALNSFFSSLLTVVMYLSKDMQNIFFWLMGSLTVRHPEQVFYTYLIVAAAGIFVMKYSHVLDILKLNEKTVFSLGVDSAAWKIRFILAASVVSAVIVSQTGIIGFIGLIMPHASRALVGDRHSALVPFAFVAGGTMMIYCDLISRVMIDSMDISIGVITSIVGAPFFILLLYASKRKAAER